MGDRLVVVIFSDRNNGGEQFGSQPQKRQLILVLEVKHVTNAVRCFSLHRIRTESSQAAVVIVSTVNHQPDSYVVVVGLLD